MPYQQIQKNHLAKFSVFHNKTPQKQGREGNFLKTKLPTCQKLKSYSDFSSRIRSKETVLLIYFCINGRGLLGKATGPEKK